nr:MAG TPA: hypothetical protein [Caudoviricetes sp.]
MPFILDFYCLLCLFFSKILIFNDLSINKRLFTLFIVVYPLFIFA